ncbi:MAG: hypothetical protein ABJB33_08560 [Gemmatimonadota bacterium]
MNRATTGRILGQQPRLRRGTREAAGVIPSLVLSAAKEERGI